MAAPTYSEDLTDIDMGQSTTGWSAFGGGGAGLGTGADFAIQSTLALDKQITNADKGAMHNDATVSLGASDHVFGWIYAATPGICDTIANHGGYMAIGTSTGNFNKYAMFGNDTRPEGGNKPWVVRYSTATPSPGAQVGTPGATPTFFGGGLNTTATAKAANLGLDAYRYGTGAYITAGDGATPATLAGFATQDEATANKWGILFRQEGAYKWQGRFAIGQDNTGTATAAHYDDTESAAVFILDTLHSQTDFTQWIIDHASTVFNCSNKTFFSLGANNPGKVVINNASASSTGWATCTWNDYGTIQGHVNVPYVGCSFNRGDQIDQNGGSFSDGTINSTTATAAMLGSNPALITSMHFISDGSSHGYECDTTGTFAWDGNTDENYTGTRGSNPAAATGSTNAMFYNNSGGLITLNVGTGGQSPSVRNGASATTVVNNTISWTISELPTGAELTITDTAATPNELFHVESTATGTEVYSFDAADAGNSVVVLVVANPATDGDLEPFDTDQTLPAANATLSIDLDNDRVYSNPA